jgi:hypothetical protein
VVDLHHRAIAAETEAKRKTPLSSDGKVRSHEAVAMRLRTKIEQHFDIAAAAAAAVHVQSNARRRDDHARETLVIRKTRVSEHLESLDQFQDAGVDALLGAPTRRFQFFIR